MSDKRRSKVAPVVVALALTLVALAACGSHAKSDSQTPANVGQAPLTTPLSPSQSAPTVSPRSATPTPTATPSPRKTVLGTPGKFVFPVVGKVSYAHDHHDYPATDILTACGNEVRAVTSGVILEVNRVDKWKASVDAGATRGGLSFSIRGDDGIRYYGSHLEEINKNIQPGVRVTAGEAVGKIGETGDASACHLHFGLSPICKGTGDWWIQRGVIWPWSYLDSWRAGGEKSPVAAVHAWQQSHGCPTKPLTDP
jgi:murein DD-endopeptidase MepM/ murein hydrolase activator NlpD